MTWFRTFVVLAVACGLVSCASTKEQNSAPLLRQVGAMTRAFQKNDVDSYLNGLPDQMIASLGNRELARAVMVISLAEFHQSDCHLDSFEVSGPPVFFKGTQNEYAVVPTRMIVTVEHDSYEVTSSMLGIRKLDSGRWHFMSPESKNTTKDMRKMFPDYPAEIKIPKQKNTKLKRDSKKT